MVYRQTVLSYIIICDMFVEYIIDENFYSKKKNIKALQFEKFLYSFLFFQSNKILDIKRIVVVRIFFRLKLNLIFNIFTVEVM